MRKNNVPVTHRMIRIADAVKVLTYAIGFIGFLSVVNHIDLSYLSAFSGLYLAALYSEYKKRFLIPRPLLTLMALSVIILTFLRNPDDLVTTAVEALLILLAIKLLGDKRFRDYMQIYLIALFLLTGSALLSMDLGFLFSFICLIFLVSVTLVLLTFFSQESTLEIKVPTLLKIASRSSLISLIAIPVTVFMFIVLPRTSYPFLNFLNRGTHATTGFSDSVRLGEVSDIQEDDTVILRAHMARIDENLLYWRGIVLDYFDGASWRSSHSEGQEKKPLRMRGRQIPQIIYLEPYGDRYLFALDKPSTVFFRNARRSGDLTYSSSKEITRRIRYESLSTLSDVLFEEKIDRDFYLQMPEGSLEKTRELVKTRFSGSDEETVVKAIMHFLRDGDYRYSLKNLPITRNPLEDFLFKYRYGNCEYFASAMAVMLRMGGIPSRIIVGYKGGYYNATGEYYLVPQKNAHVWVEAYLDNKKWMRVDPTPTGIENFVSFTKRDLFFKIRLLFDTVNYYWNALIINYDLSKQISLFYKLKMLGKPDIHISIKKEPVFAYSTFLLFIAISLFLIFRLARNKKTSEEKILNDFLRRLGKYGYKKARSEGLEEFAAKIREENLRGPALAFFKEFERSYYRDKKLTKENIQRLKRLMI